MFPGMAFPDGKPMPNDIMEQVLAWAALKEHEECWRVGVTPVGDFHVSTVWLGVLGDFDYNFETAVEFPDDGSGNGFEIVGRYASWYDALLGHNRWVSHLRLLRELPAGAA